MSTEQIKEPEDIVDRARKLLAAASPGPWFWSQSYECKIGVHWALCNPESAGKGEVIDASLVLNHTMPTWFYQKCETLPNWQLIAAAPDLIASLCNEVEALRKHVEDLNHDFNAALKEMDAQDS